MTKAAGNALTIRMYNVGFGDCFLLVLPGTPPRTMLVDAGFHSQGKGAFSGNDLAERVIADVTELTGKARIDVIVATHRHQDHVYSFNSAAWNDIEIGEVWMPWVEDRKNAAARKLWKKKHAFAMQLSAALPALGLDATTRKEVEFLLWNAGVGGGEPGFAAWSNEGALDLLHDGFSSRDLDLPRFLPTGDTFPETFATKHLPGVKVHVLGPPRDPDLIAMGNPESDDESYHALALKTAEAAGKPIPKPFTSAWVARTQKGGAKPLSADEIARLRSLARAVDPLFAAAALDNMINATSLVLVLQIGKARLLLPGDAEWGTWKLILADDKARACSKERPSSRSVITAVTTQRRRRSSRRSSSEAPRPWSRRRRAPGATGTTFHCRSC